MKYQRKITDWLKLKCPFCKSEKTIRKGIRRTKIEVKQRYFCLSCHRKFIKLQLKVYFKKQ